MALRLNIKVIPNSGKIGFIVDKDGRLKCYLKAVAQDGKANKELIKFLAQSCNVRQADIEIVLGLTSPHKVILIESMIDYEQFLKLMGLEHQKSFL